MRKIIPPAMYLGDITSGKQVDAQNRKCPNRHMGKVSKSRDNR